MISDEDLLLYYYRDGLEPEERARIGAALAAQPELAQRLHRLVSRLDAAAALPEVPVPLEIQQRWRTALDKATSQVKAQQEQQRAATPWRWMAAAAAVAAVALLATLPFSRHVTTPQMVQETPTASPSAYENGLKVHLASTERKLAGLTEASDEERAQLVQAIIEQNRIYALAAERAGEPQLARVLRAFTPVLEDVAGGREESTAASLAQLNFELRVMQARLGADGNPLATSL